MSKIIYLAHYDLPNGERFISPAGTAVMSYVLNCLEKIERQTILISPATSKKNLPREEIVNGAYTKIVLLPTLKKPKKNNIILRVINYLRHQRILKKELLNQLEDGDILVVYHSLGLMDVVKKIRRKKNITTVLQICEIYADVINNTHIKNKELEFFKIADNYIFQSNLLEELINVHHKPYAILHGTYAVSDDSLKPHTALENNEKIKCVYAGTLDPRKGGGEQAIKTALYLPENYHIHILGFGSKNEVQNIKNLISEISQKSKCTVSYDGCLSGSDYINFISSCHVGLSTQAPNAAFNSTSYPSKILSYMSNGLRVVTVRIPAIEKSCINEHVYYCEGNDPINIASAIISIDFKDEYDGKNIIQSLNEKFLENLCKFL